METINELFQDKENFIDDIPLNKAINAWHWLSFDPEKRGQRFRTDHAEQLVQLLQTADTSKQKRPDNAEKIDETFNEFRNKIKEAALSYLSSLSNTASTMVAGGGNFNVERNKKRQQWAEKKFEHYSFLIEKAAQSLQSLGKTRVEQSVKRTDDDALEQAKIRLEIAEKSYESSAAFVDEINGIIKDALSDADVQDSIELTDEEINALTEKLINAGISQNDITYVLRYNRLYLSSSLRKNIDYWKGKIKEFEAYQHAKEKATDGILTSGEFNGGRWVENVDADRYQIFFDGKPNAEIIALLKKRAWRWSPSNGAWQGYRTLNYKHSLETILRTINNKEKEQTQ